MIFKKRNQALETAEGDALADSDAGGVVLVDSGGAAGMEEVKDMSTQKPAQSFVPEVARRPNDLGLKRPERMGEGRDFRQAGGDDRRLVVGRGIKLAGEIGECDHLVIEGFFEGTLANCRSIEVAPGGSFKGNAEIQEADISGTVTGTLTVRGKLLVRSTGLIEGATRYGRLEVEDGGRLNGELTSVREEAPAKPGVMAPAKPLGS